MKEDKRIDEVIDCKKAEEKYKRALSGGNVAVWEWDIENNTFFVSDNWSNVTSYKVSEFEGFVEFIKRFALDKDKSSALNDLNFYIQGKTIAYESEYRIVTKDKKVKWVVLNGRGNENSSGRISIISGIIRDITVLKKQENEMRLIAYYDYLTGLPNRVSFLSKFKGVLEKAKEDNRKGALLLIDLDNFKAINDTLGHHYGDLLLKIFSQLLRACINKECELFRLSGDEFIIILKDFISIKHIEEICSKILDCCRSPFEIKEKQVYMTPSIGICIFPQDNLNVNDLLKRVDLAMNQSKINGKNIYTFFENSMSESYLNKQLIEHELKSSITNDELSIVFQPQINAISNKIIGMEALLRWRNNKLGWVPPSEFIPIAEKSGAILPIGEWVFEKVCKKIHEWKLKKYEFNKVSVNVSPIQIRSKNFINRITQLCEENKISPALIEIEITEGTLMELHKDKIEELNNLINKGMHVAIDDFGIGYSSLKYLTVLPVRTLKIDKLFIDNIEYKQNKAVIDCIINLSKSLKYKVIAEGVETKTQLDMLLESGCNIIQGYYFSKPVNESQIEIMLREESIQEVQQLER